MTILRLFAQIRQTSRELQADLTKGTWDDFLEELLSEENSLMNRQVDDEAWAAPQWARCMEYEFSA